VCSVIKDHRNEELVKIQDWDGKELAFRWGGENHLFIPCYTSGTKIGSVFHQNIWQFSSAQLLALGAGIFELSPGLARQVSSTNCTYFSMIYCKPERTQ
jgi:hypothetical protein